MFPDRHYELPFFHRRPEPESHPGLYGSGLHGPRRVFRHRRLRRGDLTKTGCPSGWPCRWPPFLPRPSGSSSGCRRCGPGGPIFPSPPCAWGDIVIVAGNWIELTGGHNGIVGIACRAPFRFRGRADRFSNPDGPVLPGSGFSAADPLVMHRLVYSLMGLSFMAIRNNEVLAEAVGINTFTTKLLSFVVANFFAGNGRRDLCQPDRQHQPQRSLYRAHLQLAGLLLLGGLPPWPGRLSALCHPRAHGIPAVSAGIQSDYFWRPVDRW